MPTIRNTTNLVTFNMFKTDIERVERLRGEQAFGTFMREFVHQTLDIYEQLEREENSDANGTRDTATP